MRRIIFAVMFALSASPAFAQEPVGCDKFKWPIDRERAMLRSSDIAAVASGAEIAAPLEKAITIALKPLADAALPRAPERAPRSPQSYAGFVKLAALHRAGSYHITLSAGGWIDVIQNDHFVKAGAFSGAAGCKGIRKSVTFELASVPLVVQLSGVPVKAVGVVVTPARP
jgi:hypothetical protein